MLLSQSYLVVQITATWLLDKVFNSVNGPNSKCIEYCLKIVLIKVVAILMVDTAKLNSTLVLTTEGFADGLKFSCTNFKCSIYRGWASYFSSGEVAWYAQYEKHMCRCKSGIFSAFQILCQEILHRADGGSPSEAAVVTFEGIAILTPRWKNHTCTEHLFG